ncbi:hypothetical protein pb186bvf_016951 [Paramecium bursaria]
MSYPQKNGIFSQQQQQQAPPFQGLTYHNQGQVQQQFQQFQQYQQFQSQKNTNEPQQQVQQQDQQVQQPIYNVPLIQPVFAQDYTNNDYIPDRIDLKYYGIETKVYKIKSFLILKFSNNQIVYNYHYENKNKSESEAKIIIKNLRDYDKFEYNTLYYIITEEGYWLIKVNEIDRAQLIFYKGDFQLELALSMFNDYTMIVLDPEIMNEQDVLELEIKIKMKIDEKVFYYEQQSILPNRQMTQLNCEMEKQEFQQTSFANFLEAQVRILQVNIIKQVSVNAPIHPAFSAQTLIRDLKQNFSQATSICICFLLIILIILLVYQFIIKDVLAAYQQSQQQNTSHNNIHQKYLRNK